MAEITASLVKELREKSGAGMMDCKKALTETKGDFEAAVDWLRQKGLSAAAKKSGRTAAEGLVGVAVKGKVGGMVELNSETDFVARNDKFQNLVKTISELSLGVKDTAQLAKLPYPTGGSVEEAVSEHISIIGENMNIRRMANLSVNEGIVASYVHNDVAPGLGRIGVLVALESTASQDKLTTLGKQLAMHIAASKPEALTIAEVDPVALEREKSIFAEQAKASGKPESIIEKMVEGRVRKYYEEIVLLEQLFVMDSKTKIEDVLAQASKDFGAPVKLASFARFALGEGIEQETKNFADEVASVIKN